MYEEDEFGIVAKLSAVSESGGVVDGVTVSAALARQILLLLGRLSGPRREEITMMNMPALMEELRAVLGSEKDVRATGQG